MLGPSLHMRKKLEYPPWGKSCVLNTVQIVEENGHLKIKHFHCDYADSFFGMLGNFSC